jgi:hypothetical protein
LNRAHLFTRLIRHRDTPPATARTATRAPRLSPRLKFDRPAGSDLPMRIRNAVNLQPFVIQQGNDVPFEISVKIQACPNRSIRTRSSDIITGQLQTLHTGLSLTLLVQWFLSTQIIMNDERVLTRISGDMAERYFFIQ